jgi:hypothetical protein
MAANIKDFKQNEQVKKRFSNRDIIINKYLPIESKIAFKKIIFQQCFNDKTGYFDWMLFDLFFKYLVLEFYTDLKFPKTTMEIKEGDKQRVVDIYTTYDVAVPSKLYDFVVDQIGDDVQNIRTMILESVEEKRKEIQFTHSMGYMVGGLIEKMVDLTPEDVRGLADQISKISDLKNLDIIRDLVAKNNGEPKQEG